MGAAEILLVSACDAKPRSYRAELCFAGAHGPSTREGLAQGVDVNRTAHSRRFRVQPPARDAIHIGRALHVRPVEWLLS